MIAGEQGRFAVLQRLVRLARPDCHRVGFYPRGSMREEAAP
jgi:hypothetical protein